MTRPRNPRGRCCVISLRYQYDPSTPFVRRLYANLRTSVRSQYALCTLVCVHQYDLGTECTKFARCWFETRTALYKYSDFKKIPIPAAEHTNLLTHIHRLGTKFVRHPYDIWISVRYPYDIRTIFGVHPAYIRRTSGVHPAYIRRISGVYPAYIRRTSSTADVRFTPL